MTPDWAAQYEATQLKRFATRWSIASNAALTILKLVAGVASGSVGILAELVNSAADLVGSVVVYFSVRVADVPPDEEHAYGHGKIENLSGAATAMLVVIGGITAIWQSVDRLRHPRPLTHIGWALIVMSASVAINATVSRYLLAVGRRTESPAISADGRHLQTDIITSLGVAVGLALNVITRSNFWDSIAAIGVSILILRVGYRLARDAVRTLADESLPVHEEVLIVNILRAHPAVMGYHKLRSRRSGGHRHADVHVQIADTHTFVEAHRLTEDLEESMRDALPNLHPIIHIEPYEAEEEHQRQWHRSDQSP